VKHKAKGKAFGSHAYPVSQHLVVAFREVGLANPPGRSSKPARGCTADDSLVDEV